MLILKIFILYKIINYDNINTKINNLVEKNYNTTNNNNNDNIENTKEIKLLIWLIRN